MNCLDLNPSAKLRCPSSVFGKLLHGKLSWLSSRILPGTGLLDVLFRRRQVLNFHMVSSMLVSYISARSLFLTATQHRLESLLSQPQFPPGYFVHQFVQQSHLCWSPAPFPRHYFCKNTMNLVYTECSIQFTYIFKHLSNVSTNAQVCLLRNPHRRQIQCCIKPINQSVVRFSNV